MIEDEPKIGVGGRDLRGRGHSSRGLTSRSKASPASGDVVQAMLHVGAEQPLRVRLVRDVMPKAHQALAARAGAQLRELPRNLTRGEVHPADDAGDEAMPRGQREEIPGLG